MIRPPIDIEKYPDSITLDKELAKQCEEKCICSDNPFEDIKGIDPKYDKWCKENCICRNYINYEYPEAAAAATIISL